MNPFDDIYKDLPSEDSLPAPSNYGLPTVKKDSVVERTPKTEAERLDDIYLDSIDALAATIRDPDVAATQKIQITKMMLEMKGILKGQQKDTVTQIVLSPEYMASLMTASASLATVDMDPSEWVTAFKNELTKETDDV